MVEHREVQLTEERDAMKSNIEELKSVPSDELGHVPLRESATLRFAVAPTLALERSRAARGAA